MQALWLKLEDESESRTTEQISCLFVDKTPENYKSFVMDQQMSKARQSCNRLILGFCNGEPAP